MDPQIAAARANALCEKLIKTIARAFYSDPFVLALDTLIREKFIREEEFGPRLKLTNKEVSKVIRQLESEMLIRFEDMMMDDGRTAKCYYIDYQLFVNVIRYRVHLMQVAVASAEKTELNEVFYQCPTCSNRYCTYD
jgi:transcription initiation factor TFIIE subunit alpha